MTPFLIPCTPLITFLNSVLLWDAMLLQNIFITSLLDWTISPFFWENKIGRQTDFFTGPMTISCIFFFLEGKGAMSDGLDSMALVAPQQ